MKKLDWFILKSYLGPLIMTFFIAVFILLMQFLWKYIDDLVGKGLEWYIILKLLFFASTTVVPMALPLAILLSSLMTFGNFGENYELVTMKAAGISLFRIMRSLIFVSVIISVFAFYFSDVVLPKANLKFLSLLFDIREKKLAFNLREGVFYNGIDGYVIRVGKKDADGNTIRDVMVYDHTKHMGNVSMTVAEWGRMELSSDKRFLVFRLYNGSNYEERIDLRRNEITRPFQRTRFSEQYQMFDLSGLQLTRTDENLFKKNYEMQNIRQLSFSIDSINNELKREKKIEKDNMLNNFVVLTGRDTLSAPFKRKPADNPAAHKNRKFLASYVICSFNPEDRAGIITAAANMANSVKENAGVAGENFDVLQKLIYKHQIVYQKKITFSIACFLLFFIGAPLGAIIRKGGLGMPAIVSTLFFILYWIISFIGEKYAAEGVLPVWQGMWIASVILLPIGIFLTRKATNDASLLDIDSWIKVFRKLFRIQTEQGL